MKKGSKHSIISKEKIKIARKKQGSNVWNKGLKGYGKYKGEKPCKILRQNRNYYLEELKNNAIRGIKKGYNYTEKSKLRLEKKRKEYQSITGGSRTPKNWSNKEIEYLKNNYKISRLKLCSELNRSWSSVGHKLGRLKLRKYNKWN